MTNLRKAAEMAATDLEELISWHGIRGSDDKLMPAHNQTPEIKSAMETLEALRQALAQPEQEPVAKYTGKYYRCPIVNLYQDIPLGTLLYTAPPKREWVWLDVAQFEHIEQLFGNKVSNKFVLANIICTISSMLNEKNT